MTEIAKLCTSILVTCCAMFAQEGTPSVIVDAGYYLNRQPLGIARGQLVTLLTRGVVAVSPESIRTDAVPAYEVSGISATLEISGRGLKWDLPILGVRRDGSAVPLSSRGIVVQIPMDVSQAVMNLALNRNYQPRITISENGVPGLATEFRWTLTAPRVMSYCEIAVGLSASFGCNPWITRLDGSNLEDHGRRVYPGDELVLRAGGLGVTDPPTPTGQLFSDPPPIVVAPIYVAFADPHTPNAQPKLLPIRDESWFRVNPTPASGRLGVYEVRIKIPDIFPFERPVPPSGCLELAIYIASEDMTDSLASPGIVCVDQR